MGCMGVDEVVWGCIGVDGVDGGLWCVWGCMGVGGGVWGVWGVWACMGAYEVYGVVLGCMGLYMV